MRNLWLLVAFAASVLAYKPTNVEFYTESEEYYYACTGYISVLAPYSALGGYDVYCYDENAIATMAGCYELAGGITEKNTHEWISECAEYYFYTITLQNITDSLAYLQEEGIPVANLTDPIPGNITVPVILTKEGVDAQINGYIMFLGNYNDSVYYGAGAVAFWGAVCLLGGLANWSMIIFPGLRLKTDSRVSRFWRKYITLPALWSKKKAETHSFWKVFMLIVPSRMESIVIFLFFWLIFALCTVKIHYYNDMIFNGGTDAYNRYVADRTGIIGTALLPLMLLFGGRNNFLLWITRWKYSTFITYHRWMARIVMLLVFIHSWCFTKGFVMDGYWAEEIAEDYLRWGFVGTVAGFMIIVQAILVLRRIWYEAFLLLHIVLAAFFIIGTWYHIYELGYSQYMYACFAVWGFDRVIRFCRWAIFGMPKAEVTLFADNTLRVTVKKPKYWKATPGGHAFIGFMHSYYMWQAHPFTYVEDGDLLTFFCKVKTGLTKSLYKKLVNLPGKTATMRVTIEGPYGETAPTKHHSDVVYLAGGNGIPGIFNEFQAAAKAADSKQRVKLTWIIRDVNSLAWFAKHLRQYRDSHHEITIYLTRLDDMAAFEELKPYLSGDDDSDKSIEKDSEKGTSLSILDRLRHEFPHVTFIEGRPRIPEFIETNIAEASSSIAFVICGIVNMVDEVRYQICQKIDKTEKRIDFYDALEIWA